MSGWWTVSYLVLWGVVFVLCVMVIALARQIGTLHLRLGPRGALELDDEGPPLGEAPPIVTATDREGGHIDIGGSGRDRLLLFASPGCLVCDRVLPSLHVVAAAAGMEALVITDVDPTETKLAYPPSRTSVEVVSGVDAVQKYEVPGTPYVVVLDENGVVRAKGTVNNLEQMEGLVDTARKRTTQTVDEVRAG